MSLDRVRRVRSRLIISIAGGPAASVLCGVAAVIAGEIGLARYNSPWPTFLDFLGAWSLFIGLIGLIPFRTHEFANDAMLLRALLFRKQDAVHLVASYALSTVKGNNPFPPDYVTRWFRLAAASTGLPSADYYSNWLAYEKATETEVAAHYLERCLARSAHWDDDEKDWLIAEAAVFTALRRDDAPKAEVWSKRIKSLDRLHPVWQARIRIALLCAHGQFENADAELESTLALIREAPDTPQRQRLESSWAAWREQIHQRLPVAIA